MIYNNIEEVNLKFTGTHFLSIECVDGNIEEFMFQVIFSILADSEGAGRETVQPAPAAGLHMAGPHEGRAALYG